MRTRTLRNLIGLIAISALLTVFAAVMLNRNSESRNPGASVQGATQILKTALVEKYQSDMKFADSNAEATRLVGPQVTLGKVTGQGPVAEVNVRDGGVIEYLLDKKDDAGKPLRVIHLPEVNGGASIPPISWKCYSGNWRAVSRSWSNCSYDEQAWEKERKHVAGLRTAEEKSERNRDEARFKNENERARSDFERQREQSLRDAERSREDEEKQLAVIERETERAQIETERRRRQ